MVGAQPVALLCPSSMFRVDGPPAPSLQLTAGDVLPDIIAYKYAVCGSVLLGSLPAALKASISTKRRVDVRRAGDGGASGVRVAPPW